MQRAFQIGPSAGGGAAEPECLSRHGDGMFQREKRGVLASWSSGFSSFALQWDRPTGARGDFPHRSAAIGRRRRGEAPLSLDSTASSLRCWRLCCLPCDQPQTAILSLARLFLLTTSTGSVRRVRVLLPSPTCIIHPSIHSFFHS